MTDKPTMIDAPVRHWACPACPVTDRTQRPDVHQQYHNCAGTGNLSLPLVEIHEPGAPADATHIPKLVPDKDGNPALVSVGTHHGPNSVNPGRVDRSVFLGPVKTA